MAAGVEEHMEDSAPAPLLAPRPVRAMDLGASLLSPPGSPHLPPLSSSGPPPAPPATTKPTPSRSAPKTPPRTPHTPSASRTPSRPPSRTERKFVCSHPGCSKAYLKPARLAEHVLTHTGERPHACDICGQTYLRASHLAAHLRTHRPEDDKPFPCPRPGCEKRFWTATHLKRHEDGHDKAQVHACDQCTETFPKTHLLREHHAAVHLPPGSKPFACSHEGCDKSFAMKQQLRTHEKTHDATRYACSHPDHGLNMPMFPVWSALQAHIRDEHPPLCPHPECGGRTFKNAPRLRDHLKVHAEREADLAARLAEGANESDDSSALPPVLAEGLGRRKARKRPRRSHHEQEPSGRPVHMDGPAPSASDTDGEANGAEIPSDAEETRRSARVRAVENMNGRPSPRKLPRIANGQAGKDWGCGHPGCGKQFKTRFARDEHASSFHARSAKHKCKECGRAYRRPASLRRHVVRGCGPEPNAEGSEGSPRKSDLGGDGGGSGGSGRGGGGGGDDGNSKSPAAKGRRSKDDDNEHTVALFTGTALLPGGALHRRWACPLRGRANVSAAASAEAEGHDGTGPDTESPGVGKVTACAERFHRVYDVRRHLASGHGVSLDDMAVRELLLADGQTGEEV